MKFLCPLHTVFFPVAAWREIILLLLAAGALTACARLDADARIDLLRVEPTATAAALANQERAIYVATVVPAPSVLSTLIVPPCCSTIWCVR